MASLISWNIIYLKLKSPKVFIYKWAQEHVNMKQNLIIKSLKELNIWDLFYATDGDEKVTIQNTTELKIKQPNKKSQLLWYFLYNHKIYWQINKFTRLLNNPLTNSVSNWYVNNLINPISLSLAYSDSRTFLQISSVNSEHLDEPPKSPVSTCK